MKRVKHVDIDTYGKKIDSCLKWSILLENCKEGSGIAYAQNELSVIERTLRDFITDVGYNIKEIIYPALKSGDFSRNVVTVCDLTYILHTYMEYNEGMYEFSLKTMSELLNQELDNETIGKTYEYIQKAVDRDKNFISSISQEREESLSDTFKNVEVIVDVFETFDQIRSRIVDLGERIPCENVGRKRALIATFYLYATSSIEFEKFMANGIIQSYNAVTMNIENGPVRYTGSEPKKYILV